MNRKSLTVFALIVFTLAAFAPAAAQPGGAYIEIIYPDDELSVSSSETVYLLADWYFCRAPGQANAFKSSFAVAATLDGQPVLDGSVASTRPYWSEPEPADWYFPEDCHNHESSVYGMYWVYELGQLAPGDYELAITVSYSHTVTDLFDLAPPDGKPDKYGEPISHTILLHVF